MPSRPIALDTSKLTPDARSSSSLLIEPAAASKHTDSEVCHPFRCFPLRNDIGVSDANGFKTLHLRHCASCVYAETASISPRATSYHSLYTSCRTRPAVATNGGHQASTRRAGGLVNPTLLVRGMNGTPGVTAKLGFVNDQLQQETAVHQLVVEEGDVTLSGRVYFVQLL